MSRKERDKKYYESKKGTKSKNWWFVLYPDDLPVDWKQRLINLNIRIFISPLHEHDQNADGTPKKAHHHVIFMFDSIKSLAQIYDIIIGCFPDKSESGEIIGVGHFCKENKEPDNSTSQVIINSIVQSTRYLAHLDNPEKYQYNPEQIEGLSGADPLQYLKKTTREVIQSYIDIQNTIIENGITEYSDLCIYLASNGMFEEFELVSRHATIHFRAFIDSYRNRIKEEKRIQNQERKLEVFKDQIKSTLEKLNKADK